MQMQDFDVVIVGGGLAGLALACALRETRLRLALLEQRPPSRPAGWDARVYAISPANARFLQRVGTWKHLATERMTQIHAMRVCGDRLGQIEFSAYQAGVSELAWVLESSLIACELWESIKRQSNLTLLCPARPRTVDIGEPAARLTASDGQLLSASLLVGADGRDSWLRASLGLRANETDYREMGVVANFACERPHRGIARQWFRPDGILAWLPLAGERISIVWSTPEANARELVALPANELCTRVAGAGNNQLGDLALLTPAAAFPLRLLQVPRTVAPRLALIGDAAHGIHPLSGHGINLGFQDAAALAAVISRQTDWQDIGSLRVLQAYQRERREETLLMQGTTHLLHELFANDLPGLAALRNFGMNLADRLPVVKNLLIRYAIGSL